MKRGPKIVKLSDVRSAEIVNFYLSNPSVALDVIANKFGVSQSLISRKVSHYFSLDYIQKMKFLSNSK